MPGLLDWLGLGSGAQPPPTTGLLDPQGIRQQAFYQGLGALSAGLLAAGQRRPAMQPSPLPQALLAYPQAYNQGIQSGMQSAALDTQAQDQQRMNELRASDPRYANLPTQALIAQASRPRATPMSAVDIQRAGLTPGLPWQTDQNGNYVLPAHDPNVLRAGSAATTQGRVGVEGYGVQGVGYLPPSAFAPGAPTPAPGPMTPGRVAPAAAPSQAPLPGGQPGVTRPYTPADFPGDPDAASLAESANQQQPLPAGSGQAMPTQTAQAQGQGPQPRVVQVPGMRGPMIMAPSQGETQRDSREGHNDAERTNGLGTTALNSANQVPLLQRQIQLLDRGVQVGGMAGGRTALAGMIRTFAPEGSPLRGLADAIMSPDARAFQSAAGELVLARTGGSLGPGISNADAIRFDQLVPQVYDDPAAARELAQILLRAAVGNARDAHEAYSASKNSYNARTDPVTRQLHVLGRRAGIDFLTPDTENPQQGPPQPGRTGVAPPVVPGGAGTPPPAISAPVTIGGQRGVESAIPPRPGQQPSAQVQITPMTQRDGRNIINESQLRDGVTYSGGILGPGQHRWNAQARTFTRVD